MSNETRPTTSRRTVLRGVGSAAAVGVGLTATTPAAAQSVDYGGWFENTSNFDGTVDETGTTEVTITVGSAANGGKFGFGPAAVRVDPGTTVTWEWSGGGGSHNVVADDGTFESELVGEEGHTFSYTFENEGVYKYACTPHKAVGMKGAVVVGSPNGAASGGQSTATATSTPDGTATEGTAAGGTSAGEPDYGNWFENTSNFDGTVDRTGTKDVTVTVGSEANGGKFGFGPAAVRVSPGTTVTWEWSGGGGSHNVVAEGGEFESELVGEEGHTFSHTFDEPGVYRYACTPHKAMGMKGAVVVSESGASGSGTGGTGASGDAEMSTPELLTLGGGVSLVGVLLGAFGLATHEVSLDGADASE